MTSATDSSKRNLSCLFQVQITEYAIIQCHKKRNHRGRHAFF